MHVVGAAFVREGFLHHISEYQYIYIKYLTWLRNYVLKLQLDADHVEA